MKAKTLQILYQDSNHTIAVDDALVGEQNEVYSREDDCSDEQDANIPSTQSQLDDIFADDSSQIAPVVSCTIVACAIIIFSIVVSALIIKHHK
jgi:hypothetical protein